MCDLLGMSFSTPMNARLSLDTFQLSGKKNPDGWGLGYYRDKNLQVIKEAKPSLQSGLYDYAEGYIKSRLYISHVRRLTRGSRSYLNTHPFYRKLIVDDQRYEWLFAHNGTLSKLDHLKLNKFMPLGETDSEYAFCFILQSILNRKITSWNDDNFTFIEKTLRDINSEHNTLNCIFSDGTFLFCYSDETKHNNGLRFMKKLTTQSRIDLVSRGKKLGLLDFQSINVGGDTNRNDTGYIVVTRTLAGKNWVEFNNGELIVFKDGRILYPYSRR